jgi:hypothetical protein
MEDGKEPKRVPEGYAQARGWVSVVELLQTRQNDALTTK